MEVSEASNRQLNLFGDFSQGVREMVFDGFCNVRRPSHQRRPSKHEQRTSMNSTTNLLLPQAPLIPLRVFQGKNPEPGTLHFDRSGDQDFLSEFQRHNTSGLLAKVLLYRHHRPGQIAPVHPATCRVEGNNTFNHHFQGIISLDHFIRFWQAAHLPLP